MDINTLSDKQKKFLVFMQELNRTAVRYTSVPIMIQREPIDTNLIEVILTEKEYHHHDKEYLTALSEGFFEYIKSHKILTELWKEYNRLYTMNKFMNTSNHSTKIWLEEKLKIIFTKL